MIVIRYKMFYHLSLEDNPTYTQSQLEAYYREYPKNSYMYFSRILGVRGFTEESPFSSYTTQRILLNLIIRMLIGKNIHNTCSRLIVVVMCLVGRLWLIVCIMMATLERIKVDIQ